LLYQGAFLWCRKDEAFCERQFTLHRQQPEKDKQKDDFAPPGKISPMHIPWKNSLDCSEKSPDTNPM